MLIHYTNFPLLCVLTVIFLYGLIHFCIFIKERRMITITLSVTEETFNKLKDGKNIHIQKLD